MRLKGGKTNWVQPESNYGMEKCLRLEIQKFAAKETSTNDMVINPCPVNQRLHERKGKWIIIWYAHRNPIRSNSSFHFTTMKKSHVNLERLYEENKLYDYKLYFRYRCRTTLRPNSWQMQSNGTFNSYCSNRLTPINSSLLVTISISFGIHIRYLIIIIITKIF